VSVGPQTLSVCILDFLSALVVQELNKQFNASRFVDSHMMDQAGDAYLEKPSLLNFRLINLNFNIQSDPPHVPHFNIQPHKPQF